MRVRCESLFPGQELEAWMTDTPSMSVRGETDRVLAVDGGGVEVQLAPPQASGAVIVEADDDERRALSSAGYDLPDAAPPTDYDAGVAAYHRGDLPGAIAAFTRALAANPDDVDALFNRGYMFSVQVQQLPSLHAFGVGGDVGSVVDPRIPELLGQAIADYSRALEVDPEFTKALGMRGEMYFLRGDQKRAVEDYRRAAALGDEIARRTLRERWNLV